MTGASLLSDLPSSGLCTFAPKPGRVRTVHAPTYLPVHDTSPPADQIITTTDSNQLLERFRALLKEKDARMLKRAGAEVGAARPDKRPKL